MRRYAVIIAMAALLIAGVWGNAPAQTEEELIAIREAADIALNAHDLDLWASYFTDDGVLDLVSQPPPAEGKEAMKAFMGQAFQAFPDWHTTPGRILASGNIVVVEHTYAGTQQEEWFGIPATGKAWELPHIDIYEFEGDKIKRLTTYDDNVTFMIQLGLMPPSELPPLVPSFTLPDPEPTGLSAPEATVEFNARFNAHNLPNFAKMIRSDADIAANGMQMDVSGYIGAVENIYFSAHSDLQLETVRTIDMGDGWILNEVLVVGTDDGGHEVYGWPVTNQPIELRLAMIEHYDADGLITYLHFYYDLMTEMIQLGLMPPPEPSVVSPSTWGDIKAKFR